MGHPIGDVIRYERALTKTGRVAQGRSATPVPVFGKAPKQLWPGEVFEALRPLFFSKRRKIGHNVKFDLCSTEKYWGEPIPGPFGDTGVGCHLLNENHQGYKPYGLEACSRRETGFTWEKSFGAKVEVVPFTFAARYSYFDAKYDWLVWRSVKPQLEDEGLWDLFEVEMDVLEVVCHMEQTGVTIDVPAIKKIDESFTAEINETYEKIVKAAGWNINLNADAEVRKLVYDIRKHKPIMWTEKTRQPSTAAKALEGYAEKDEVVAAVLHWAELHKMHVTFVQGIRKRLVDGRVHCDFDQRGARTGRFSSREPNLQNIPTRQTKVIRDIFMAPPGHKLIVADYNQIELRILAHFTRDPMLLKAYREGLNLHMITARRAYRIPEDQEPTDRQYGLAKNCNFTLAYRGSPETLAARYEVPLKDAQLVYDAFYGTYRHVKPWQDAVVKQCKKNRVSKDYASWSGKREAPPHVTTILGRKRRLPEIFWSDRGRRNAAERQAINTVIQGSAGDIMKLAMVNVYRAFRDHPGWSLVLTVHDELVAVVPEADAEEAKAIMKDRMENLILPKPLLVPLLCDVKVCDRWSEK
jgi:DNA polymerase I-like protein with 3'-5' exonuclease and polymerase domains